MSQRKFVYEKLKFGLTSSFATLVDYVIYVTLIYVEFTPVVANAISYSNGIVVNFFLQRTFIFQSKRNAYFTFFLSVTFSLIGLGISSLIIYTLLQIPTLNDYPVVVKMISTGVVFFYNFYTKRFAFQGLK